VAEGLGHPIPGWRRFEIHEVTLVALGIGTTFALLAARHGRTVLREALTATTIYAAVISTCRSRRGGLNQKFCFIASFAFVLWFYWAIERITPALGTRLRDGVLLALDQAMFGQTPAVYCERIAASWSTDLMSLCYTTYHFYLAIVVVHAIRDSNFANQQLSAYLFTSFAIGFIGYLLVPALGPAITHPELFSGPLPGGTISRFIGNVVAKGSSGYDTFPSLHIMITCILLDHDWRAVRQRFWIMVVPSIGLMISTIYLRYHYAVDLLAGFLLFLALRQTFLKTGIRKVGLAN
jgi:hypothetical protein